MPGTDYTWSSAGDTDWGTSTNWTPNGVPGTDAADTVTIDAREVQDETGRRAAARQLLNRFRVNVETVVETETRGEIINPPPPPNEDIDGDIIIHERWEGGTEALDETGAWYEVYPETDYDGNGSIGACAGGYADLSL